MEIKNIYYADFETLTKESQDFINLGHTDVFLIYLKTNEQGYYFNNLDEFFNFLLYENSKSAYIYFHNLSFDGDFIIKYLIRKHPRYFKNSIDINKQNKRNLANYFYVFNSGNKIYYIEYFRTIYINGKKKKIKLIFKCSYNILSGSIESLGKSLGHNKKQEETELINKGLIQNTKEFYNLGSFNMQPEIDHYFKKYIKKDVEIAQLSLDNFINEIINNYKLIYSKRFDKNCINPHKCFTIATIVYKLSLNNIYNNFGYEYFKKYKIKGTNYEFYKNWYYGGFTQFNEQYHNKWIKNKKIKCFDINSSYPFQMTKLLPVGELYETINPKWDNYIEWYELDVEYAEIKNKYYNFVILKNWKKETADRYVRTQYNFKCYYTKQEYDFINKIYDFKIKTKKVYYSEAFYILKDFVNTLYQYKEHYANIGDEAKKYTYKIMLNSLYGVQCKRDKFNTILYVDKETHEKMKEKNKNIENYVIMINEREYKVNGFKNEKIFNSEYYGVYLLPLKEKKKTNNILIGAAITSYARLQIWELIYKVGIENWYYTDTDSVFINDVENINDLIEIDKSKLGAWDLECELEGGKILGAKRYYFLKANNKGVKFGFSGVDIEPETFEWEQLFNEDIVLSDMQQVVKRDDYGIYFDFRDYHIKKGGL